MSAQPVAARSPDPAPVRPRRQRPAHLRGTPQAIGLLLLLLAFALSVNGLNVVNSYVGRDFMTAIAHRDMAGFVRLAILYVGVFAAIDGGRGPLPVHRGAARPALARAG